MPSNPNDHASVFPNKLKEAILSELPGISAHVKMLPQFRSEQIETLSDYIIPDSAVTASVVCLIYPHENQHYFLLMKRVTYPGVHSGQISFPGGKLESGETFMEAALRETEEETGIQLLEKDVLGQLSDIYIPPSNFHVKPFVCFLPLKPTFEMDPKEVEYLIEARLSDLVNEELVKNQKMETRGVSFIAPYFDLNDEVVWGATAAMLSEVKDLFVKHDLKSLIQ